MTVVAQWYMYSGTCARISMINMRQGFLLLFALRETRFAGFVIKAKGSESFHELINPARLNMKQRQGKILTYSNSVS
jgi:hypothetical protein